MLLLCYGFSLFPIQLAGFPVVPVSDQHCCWPMWSTVRPGTIHHQMGGHRQGQQTAPNLADGLMFLYGLQRFLVVGVYNLKMWVFTT